MKLIATFIALSIINVIFSTVRSITTIKGGKSLAAFVSAGYFAFYNIVMIYTVMDFPLWQKCLITFCCNLVGVFAVKWGEELVRRDKIWKVEVTVCKNFMEKLKADLDHFGISYNLIETSNGKWVTFNCYCPDKTSSHFVHEIVNRYNAKYFISETKNF